MLRKIVPAIILCIGLGAAQQARAEKYLDLYVVLIPTGEGDTSGTGSDDLDFSYGAGVDMEWELTDFLLIGGSLQYRSIHVDISDDANHELHLDPTLRLLYPGETWHPYARLRIGASFMWPSNDPVELDFGAGWNIDVMGGIAFRTSLMDFFLEMGFGRSTVESYLRGGGDHPLTISYQSMLLNLGLSLGF